jgi:prepilin peptidase CpaA
VDLRTPEGASERAPSLSEAKGFVRHALMSWIAPAALFLEILLLVYVATIDIATRLIRNEVCLALALLGIASQFASPMQVAQSLIVATILFLLLFVIYHWGKIGGGDVKLLVALAVGLPLTGMIRLLTATALAGGVLALVHLMMRLLPYPSPAPAGSSVLRRVYAVERWRHLRHAPLPYGVAIACGGVWSILSRGS